MEEKNLASEMLSQMKRFVGQESPAPEKNDKYQPVTPERKRESKVRSLPGDDSLFEFDEFVFDDDVNIPEKPVLTGEEAEYADELSEKFGVSKDVGVGFLSAEAQPSEEVDETEEDDEAEEVEEAEETEEVDETEKADETGDDADKIFAALKAFVQMQEGGSEENEAPEVVEETVEVEAPEVVEETEPVQVMFGEEPEQETEEAEEVEEKEAEEEEAEEEVYEPIPTITPGGIQLTFLDSDDDEEEAEPEQIMLIDTAPDKPRYTSYQRREAEPIFEDVIPTQIGLPITEEDEFEDVIKEPEEEITDSETDEPAVEEPTVEDVPAEEQEAAPVIEEAPAPETVTLTAIELNAIEEQERMAAEEEVTEEVVVETFEEDVWDERDRKLWADRKRYIDYCDALVVPSLKITKEPHKKARKRSDPNASSGYRYEMTERLPIFADGVSGGKDTESYFSREMEYCEEREAKRTKQLLDKLRLTWKKTIFSFVIMLTVILLENINVFFGGAPDKLLTESNALLFALIEIVLLGIGAALIFDAIKDGLRLAFKGVFVPETLTAGIVIPAIVYHAAVAALGTRSSYVMLFGTGAAISMFLCALYRYFMLKREYVVFSVASSFGEYTTEVRLSGFRNSPEGKAFDGYADPDSTLYRLNKVERIDGCYTDKPVRDECYGLVRKLSLCIICAAVVAGVVFGIIRRDVFYGVLSAISLITLAAPVSVFVALLVPRIRTANVSAEVGGAVVDFDDESDEFESSVFMLDDGELFPADKLVSSGFEMQRSPGIEAHLSRTLALFKKIGGTLDAVFSNMETGLDNCESVEITEIAEHGITAKIDGKEICAGSETYLEKLGIKVKRYEKLLPKNGRVMYIADNGVFFARAILTFKPDEELVRKISELRNTETVFSLKTCNPCIDRELIFYTTGLEPELVRLIKYEPGDDVAPASTDREGSIVSKNGAFGLITSLLEYKRQKKLIFKASRFACVACVTGAFVSLLASAVGLGFGFFSLTALATHGALSLAGLIVASRSAINTKSKIKKQ